MPKKPLPHIFVKDAPTTNSYTSTRSGGKPPRMPERNRSEHGNFLRQSFNELWKQSKEEAVAVSDRKGIYVEFQSKEQHDLITESLEDLRHGIRLLNIREEAETTFATVYIPSNKVSIFVRKIDDYLHKETKKGKPKNSNLINSIENIRLAVVRSFWRDIEELLPDNNEAAKCEVWLQISRDTTHEDAIMNFFKVCDSISIDYIEDQEIHFPERAVVMVQATHKDLEQLIKSTDLIAEFRKVRETASFWVNEKPNEQREWAESLLKRITYDEKSNVSICILDTGVSSGHTLIAPLLSDQDCLTIENSLGIDDKDGHGTLMAGLAIYGNPDFRTKMGVVA